MRARFFVTLAVAAAGAVALACNSGDDVHYAASSTAPPPPPPPPNVPDGGFVDDSGRVIAPPTDADLPDVQAPVFSQTVLRGCPGLDADVCDWSAGEGCCFNDGDTTEGTCMTQASVFQAGATCKIFLACASDTGDNACCWTNGVGGLHTQFMDSCNGAHACVVGETCTDGTPCNTLPSGCGTASTLGNIGYCGAVPPCGS
jgi:hypothetical protein